LKALPGLLPRSHAHDPPTRYFPRPPPTAAAPNCAVGEAEEEEEGAEEGEEEEEEILEATDGLREETGYQPLRLLQAHLTYPTSHHN